MRSLIASIILLLGPVSLLAQSTEALLDDVLVIGDEEQADPAYLFTAPQHVVVDDQGHFYVADARSAEIRLFDAEGKLVNVIGSRGKGPGELHDVSGMFLNDRGELVVADRFNQRITVFTEEGEEVNTVPFPEDTYLDVHNAYFLADGMYLLSYKLPHYESTPDPNPDLFHLFDNTLTEVRASIGDFGLLYDADDPFHRAISLINPFSSATDGATFLYVAPAFYEGAIYRISLKGEEAGFMQFNGHTTSFSAYTLLHPDTPRSNQSVLKLSHRVHGKYTADVRKWSLGLFLLSDGRLLHFSSIVDKKAKMYGVELFEADGTYRGYYPLKGYASTVDEMNIMTPLAVDKNDQLYIADYRSGAAVLRVVTLKFD